MSTASVLKTVVNSSGMKFALIPAGTFLMGSPQEEQQRSKDEDQHEVAITRPFYLGVFPVTQGQFHRIMGYNPSYFSKDGAGKDKVAGLNTSRFPVESVSWNDSQQFLKKLHGRVSLPTAMGKGKFMLPHEDEWEYAAHGGQIGRAHV